MNQIERNSLITLGVVSFAMSSSLRALGVKKGDVEHTPFVDLFNKEISVFDAADITLFVGIFFIFQALRSR